MFYTNRVKLLITQGLAHVQTNATTYVTMIGAITQKDFPTVITCLKVLGLRAVVGAIRNGLIVRKKDPDDSVKK